MKYRMEFGYSAMLASLMFAGVLASGCDRKETLLEVDTPRSGVEVQRDRDTGEITVDVDN